MIKKCTACLFEKDKSLFYGYQTRCKDCYNFIRRNKYKKSICLACNREFRPDKEGRYKFCSNLCRFFIKVTKEQSCWIWNAGLNDKGYGIFVWGKLKNGLAHRFSYEIHKGEIPQNMFVLHKCHNTKCVNPDHLYVGNQQDNMNDMKNAGRQISFKGSKSPVAKLNEDIVHNIKKLRLQNYSYKKIAELTGVAWTNVSQIIQGRTWKHVQI